MAYYICCTLPNEYFFLAILNANHSALYKVNVLFLDFEKMQEQEVAYLLKLSVCAKNASEIIRPLLQRILNSVQYIQISDSLTRIENDGWHFCIILCMHICTKFQDRGAGIRDFWKSAEDAPFVKNTGLEVSHFLASLKYDLQKKNKINICSISFSKKKPIIF